MPRLPGAAGSPFLNPEKRQHKKEALVPRTYHKSWQNRRPGWTRRVRWFQGLIGDDVTIRLNFVDTDEGRGCNRFYTSDEEAQAVYEAFIAGELSVRDLMAARP